MKATKMFRNYSDPDNDPVFSEVRLSRSHGHVNSLTNTNNMVLWDATLSVPQKRKSMAKLVRLQNFKTLPQGCHKVVGGFIFWSKWLISLKM